MPHVMKQIEMTAGNLDHFQFFASSFHIAGSHQRAQDYEIPLPPDFVISGVDWTPHAGMQNLTKAFRWIRVRRAPVGRDRFMLAASAKGIPGRGIITVRVSIEILAPKPITSNKVLNVDDHAFRMLATDKQGGKVKLSLPTPKNSTVGTEFFVRVDDGELTVKTNSASEAKDDVILIAQNPTDGRVGLTNAAKSISTDEQNASIVISCRQPGVWVAENRSGAWQA